MRENGGSAEQIVIHEHDDVAQLTANPVTLILARDKAL
jgi:hypothetical protein